MRVRTVTTRMKKTLNHLNSLEYRMRANGKKEILKIIHDRKRILKDGLSQLEPFN